MIQRHPWGWGTFILLSAVALDLLMLSLCHADALVYTTQVPVQGGLKGLVIDRPAVEPYATGIIWEQSGVPAWGSGVDITQDYPGQPDLVLAFNPWTNCDNLRIRSDDARMTLGPRIGHPVWPFQLALWPGANIGGMVVGTTNWQHNLLLWNENSGAPQNNFRNTINWQNLYCLQSDSGANGTNDFYLYSWLTNSKVWWVGADGSYRVDAPQEGFFSAPPVSRPTVTGSWADGSAAKSLLAALAHLGLVKDETTQ